MASVNITRSEWLDDARPGRMVFGKIVGFIEAALSPIYKELSLTHPAVANPIKMHVDGFRAFLFDAVIGDAGSSAVVSLD